jgi:hypothetical protein
MPKNVANAASCPSIIGRPLVARQPHCRACFEQRGFGGRHDDVDHLKRRRKRAERRGHAVTRPHADRRAVDEQIDAREIRRIDIDARRAVRIEPVQPRRQLLGQLALRIGKRDARRARFRQRMRHRRARAARAELLHMLAAHLETDAL